MLDWNLMGIIFKATDKDDLLNWNTAVIWVSQRSQDHRGHEPFGFDPLGCERRSERLKIETLKAEGLIGCPFDPAQGN